MNDKLNPAEDYAHKCDCSDDDRCGCTYPNNTDVNGAPLKMPVHEHNPNCKCTPEHHCGCYDGKPCKCGEKNN